MKYNEKIFARLKVNTLNRLQMKSKKRDYLTPLKIERERSLKYENKPVNLKEIVAKALDNIGGHNSKEQIYLSHLNHKT